MSKQSVPRANRWGDLLWVRAAVGGKDSSVIKVRLLVDTGASFTLLPTKVVQLAGCDLERPIRTQNITSARRYARGSNSRCALVQLLETTHGKFFCDRLHNSCECVCGWVVRHGFSQAILSRNCCSPSRNSDEF